MTNTLNIYLRLIFIVCTQIVSAQIVQIPDLVFKNKLLEANSTNTIAKNLDNNFFQIDSNNDGEIQESEAAEVLYLNLDFVSDPGTLSSLDGIESFTNLETLITYELAIEDFNYALNSLLVLDLSYHLIEEIHLENFCSLQSFESIQSPSNLANRSLKEIYLKNGSAINSFMVDNASDLNLVCGDDSELTLLENALAAYTDITINSDCTGSNCSAVSNSPPVISATGDQDYCPLTAIKVVEDFSITDIDNTTIDGLNIQISTGYVFGEDILSLTGTHPNVVVNWNAPEGKLELSGINGAPLLFSDVIDAVKDVVFSSNNIAVQGERTFSFTIGDANYLPSTGHFYQYVSSPGITWTAARDLAETYTYYDLKGYLVTLTSADEAQLSGEQAEGTGWIGASDMETEGVWKWMTGPEAGSTFWLGSGNGTTTGTDIPYANWNELGNEPNNLGNEDYAHIVSPNLVTIGQARLGTWNDLPNSGDLSPSSDYHPQGFIVEYGGTPGDPELNLSASTRISIPIIENTLTAESCGPASVTLEATPSSGTTIWFDAISGGNQLGTGLTFTTPFLNTTTTYYALPSVNGCAQGVRIPVEATIIEIPAITAFTEDVVCINNSGTITATPSAGSVKWFTAETGGTLVSTETTFVTMNLTTTTTYYAEPDFNGCIGPRQAVTITVLDTPAPTGNAVQMYCDVNNATVADLSATGTNIQWYTSANGGTTLGNTEVLNDGMYYATQTISGCESTSRFPVEVIIYETVQPTDNSEIPMLTECDFDFNDIEIFDLTLNETILLNGSQAANFIFEYYSNSNYTNQILTPESYTNLNAGGDTIYVRILNVLNPNCFTDLNFDIKVLSVTQITSSVVFENCDSDGLSDGITDFNLSEIDEQIILDNTSDFSLTYHLSLLDAELNLNAISDPIFNNAVSSRLYARVENTNGCYSISEIELEVSTTSLPTGFYTELILCDEDELPDGFFTFDLSQANQEFIDLLPSNESIHYYLSYEEALLEQNEILEVDNFTNSTPYYQEIYVRIESEENGNCYDIGPYLRLIVNERPQFEVTQSDVFCLDGGSITLEVISATGQYSYIWLAESGDIVGTGERLEISDAGQYTLQASSTEGCQSFPYTFDVIQSSPATISIDDITVEDLSNTNTISINTDNLGVGDYEFSLDDEFGLYQDEPFFDNVSAGDHILYVRDKNGCATVSVEVFVLGFPKYFTPNGDMYNEYWTISGWNSSYSNQSKIYIFDRFGKLIYQFTPLSNGWDGRFNGQPVLESDYWFVAELLREDGTLRKVQGHFSLIR